MGQKHHQCSQISRERKHIRNTAGTPLNTDTNGLSRSEMNYFQTFEPNTFGYTIKQLTLDASNWGSLHSCQLAPCGCIVHYTPENKIKTLSSFFLPLVGQKLKFVQGLAFVHRTACQAQLPQLLYGLKMTLMRRMDTDWYSHTDTNTVLTRRW